MPFVLDARREMTMFVEACWKFLEKEDRRVRKMLRKACRGRYELCEEMYCEVVLQYAPRLFETYDETKGELIPYIINSLRWYCFKWMNKRAKSKDVFHEDVQDIDPPEEPQVLDLDLKDEVESLLKGLSEYDRYLLVAYHCGGLTFAEIGEALGIGKATALRHYHAAMSRARLLAYEDK